MTGKSSSSSSGTAAGNRLALIYCVALALQFGFQPILQARFIPRGASKTSIVIATEMSKILISIISIGGEGPKAIRSIISEWSIVDSCKIALVPATLYAIQNLLVQYAYTVLDSMTFSLLNQTKTLSAAFWLWVLMGKPQSGMQLVALLLLLGAAVLLNLGGAPSTNAGTDGISVYNSGLLAVISASMLSGLSSALTQKTLVGESMRSKYPLFFSAELAIVGIMFLLVNGIVSGGEKAAIMSGHLFDDWDTFTILPVITNAFGGLVVGMVTKYAGGVVKGFALIAGIVITAVLQWILEGKPLSEKDWLAAGLVSGSIYLHASFPYTPIKEAKVDESKDDMKKKN